LVCNASVRA